MVNATHCNTLQRTATHAPPVGAQHLICNTHTTSDLFRRVVVNATYCNTLQRTATHWPPRWSATFDLQHTRNICPQDLFCGVVGLQHTATHCNTLQHTATHCNTLTLSSIFCGVVGLQAPKDMSDCNTLQHTATHCNAMQHTGTHWNTLQHTATHCNTLQHTATRCNTLQHTATRCNTLPPAATLLTGGKVAKLNKFSSAYQLANLQIFCTG